MNTIFLWGSQSQCRIWFILPAHRTSHIIIKCKNSLTIHYLTVKGTLWIALLHTVYRTSLDQSDPIILLFTKISTAWCTLIKKLIPPAKSKTAITLRASLNTLTRKLSLVFSSSWNTTKKQNVKANQKDDHVLLSQSFFWHFKFASYPYRHRLWQIQDKQKENHFPNNANNIVYRDRQQLLTV